MHGKQHMQAQMSPAQAPAKICRCVRNVRAEATAFSSVFYFKQYRETPYSTVHSQARALPSMLNMALICARQ
jgi:hypothetical protein